MVKGLMAGLKGNIGRRNNDKFTILRDPNNY